MFILKKILDFCFGSLLFVLLEYNVEMDEYFFDYSLVLFNEILDLYCMGELYVLFNCCGVVLQRELEYWKIFKCFIFECCIYFYYSYVQVQNIIQFIRELFEDNILDYSLMEYRNSKMKKMFRIIWIILDQFKFLICVKVCDVFLFRNLL